MPFVTVKFARRIARSGRWRDRIALWARNWRTRRALARLDPARLADIGVTEAEARREAARPFWQG
jgi:uncharacterized protein YjiS (DUF1127 family)